MAGSTLLVGIDEAGYGPVLGPLVISAAAFETPAVLAEQSLWTLLKASVSRRAVPPGGRVAILDSKKLHVPKDGIRRLERTALAAITAWENGPTGLRALLSLIAPDTLAKLAEYPWYRDADPQLPRGADPGGIRIAARLLKNDLEAHSVRIAGLASEILLEGHYNQLVKSTQNKAVVLLGLTLRLMQRIVDAYPDRDVHFFIDKQGSRDFYGPILLRSFEDRRLKVLAESENYSAYELVNGRSSWQVNFRESGESAHLPTALASILSKYLRELLMEAVNEYWQRHVPALKRTAGYYKDGIRFLSEIGPHAARLGIDRETFERSR